MVGGAGCRFWPRYSFVSASSLAGYCCGFTSFIVTPSGSWYSIIIIWKKILALHTKFNLASLILLPMFFPSHFHAMLSNTFNSYFIRIYEYVSLSSTAPLWEAFMINYSLRFGDYRHAMEWKLIKLKIKLWWNGNIAGGWNFKLS